VRFSFFILAAVCGLCLLALPQLPVPAEPQEVAGQIDFDTLHAQATAALESLRQAHERRAALATTAEF
jgi:hypothetical protein